MAAAAGDAVPPPNAAAVAAEDPTAVWFHSSPRIVPASSQIITNPRNLLKIVA